MDQPDRQKGRPSALYICTTYYHVYITLLKLLHTPTEIDLVICDDIPTGQQLTKRLEEAKLFRHVWFVRQSLLPEVRGKNLLDWILFQHRRRYRTLRPMLPFALEEYRDVYIYHDGTPLGMYLADARKPYHLIEDSMNFYQRIMETPERIHLKQENLKFLVRRFLRAGYFFLGQSPFVLDIEVNNSHNLQVHGKPVVECPIDRLTQSLTSKEKQIILDIFGCHELPCMHGNDALLLTEPNRENGTYLSEERRYALYKSIVERLTDKGYCVVLKPHPRDTADYRGLGVPVLERTFPVELLNYLWEPEFQCVVATASSAVYTVRAKQIYLYKVTKEGCISEFDCMLHDVSTD